MCKGLFHQHCRVVIYWYKLQKKHPMNVTINMLPYWSRSCKKNWSPNIRQYSLVAENVPLNKLPSNKIFKKGVTLLGTSPYPPLKALLKMIFLFPRWDMLVPWRVFTTLVPNDKVLLNFLAFISIHWIHGMCVEVGTTHLPSLQFITQFCIS